MIELPRTIQNMIGEGAVVITVETQSNWRFSSAGDPKHEKKLKWASAEELCVHEGGHLASIGSQENQDEITRKTDDVNQIWVGGRRKISLSD